MIPIPYDNKDDHRVLTDTLTHWAACRSDPLNYRANDVLQGITALPTGMNDETVKRVIWALSDETGKAAKALAESDPFTSGLTFKNSSRGSKFLTRPGSSNAPHLRFRMAVPQEIISHH